MATAIIKHFFRIYSKEILVLFTFVRSGGDGESSIGSGADTTHQRRRPISHLFLLEEPSIRDVLRGRLSGAKQANL